jgi:hypothetical protein
MPLCTCGCGRNISRQQIYNHITCGAPLSIQISHAASQDLDDLPLSPVGSTHDTALAEVNRQLEYAAPRYHGDPYSPEPFKDLTIPNDAIHHPCFPGNLLPSAEVKLWQAESTWDWVDKGLVLEPFKTLVLLLALQSIRTCRIRDLKEYQTVLQHNFRNNLIFVLWS